MEKKNMQWGIIVALVFALIISLFALANMDHTTVNFLVWEASVPLVIVILLSTLVGAVIIASFSFANQISNARKVKKLQKQLEQLEEELAEQKKLVIESKKTIEKKSSNNQINQETTSSNNGVSAEGNINSANQTEQVTSENTNDSTSKSSAN